MARILMVDDSGVSRRMLRKALGPGEHEILEAQDGMSALEQYGLQQPDLVLLDLTMPGIHGLEVLDKLIELDPQARVIIATADIQRSTRTLAEEGGALGFVTKPFVAEQVQDEVNRVLNEANGINDADTD